MALDIGPFGFWLLAVLFAGGLIAMCGRGPAWTFVGAVCTVSLLVIAFGYPDRLGMNADPASRHAGFLFICALFLSAWGSRSYKFRGDTSLQVRTSAQATVRALTMTLAWVCAAIAVWLIVRVH